MGPRLRSVTFLIAVGLVVAAAVAGCGGAGQGGQSVRVGFVPEAAQAVPLLGFSRARHALGGRVPGASLHPQAFPDGPAALKALRAGAVDVAFIGPAPLISGFWEGKDVVALANTAMSGTVLVARPGRTVRSVADLSKLTVAVPALGSTSDVLLRYQMALNGLRPVEDGGTVTVRAMPVADVEEAFRKGTVDAACVPEPWSSHLEWQAGAAVALGSAEIFSEGNYPSAILVARRDFAQRHPEIAKSLAEAAEAIAREIAPDPPALAPVLAPEIRRWSGQKVSEEAMGRALRRCHFRTDLTQHDINVFANLVEVAGYKKDMAASLDGVFWLGRIAASDTAAQAGKSRTEPGAKPAGP